MLRRRAQSVRLRRSGATSAFVRVWAAATISIFGSLVTRIALPLVAILVLGVGRDRGRDPAQPRPRRRARVRAGRRGVGGPAAAAPGPDLGRPRTGRAAGLDPGRVRAGRADVPAAAGRDRPGGGADRRSSTPPTTPTCRRSSSASGWSTPTARCRRAARRSEFIAFGISGFLVQVLTRARSRSPSTPSRSSSSAVLLGSIRRRRRRHRRRRGPRAGPGRDPRGLRLVRHDPILRAFVGAQMAISHDLWGIFGATWFLFVARRARPRTGRARRGRRGRRGLVVHRRARRDARDATLGDRSGRHRGDRPLDDRQRVHPAGAGRAAARRRRLPGHRSSSSATRR